MYMYMYSAIGLYLCCCLYSVGGKAEADCTVGGGGFVPVSKALLMGHTQLFGYIWACVRTSMTASCRPPYHRRPV